MTIITKNDLIQEGYTVGNNLEEAIYILTDGSLWDGAFDYGSRCNDHREAEAFSEYDRYDGEQFWEDITVNKGLLMLVPETKLILQHPEQELSQKQIELKNDLISEYGYEVEELK